MNGQFSPQGMHHIHLWRILCYADNACSERCKQICITWHRIDIMMSASTHNGMELKIFAARTGLREGREARRHRPSFPSLPSVGMKRFLLSFNKKFGFMRLQKCNGDWLDSLWLFIGETDEKWTSSPSPFLVCCHFHLSGCLRHLDHWSPHEKVWLPCHCPDSSLNVKISFTPFLMLKWSLLFRVQLKYHLLYQNCSCQFRSKESLF